MAVLPGLPRRRALLLGAALATPAIIRARAAETLVVNAYGGEFRDIFEPLVVKPFEKKFGVQVTYDDTGGAAENYAKIRATRGAPGFDVANELTPPEIIAGAREKLLERLTEKEVPNLRHVWKKSREVIPDVGVVHSYQYVALVWNRNHMAKPDSWSDYWEADKRLDAKARGHLLGYNPAANLLEIYSLLMAAKIKGGGPDNMDPAWALLKANNPWRATNVGASAEAAPYFENDSVWLSPYWSARAAYYANKKYPIGFTIPKEGTIGLANVSAIPIGAKNKKLAYEFVNFQLEPDIHRAFSLAYFSTPARPDIDWPADFAATQIVTEAQMQGLDLPDSAVLGRKRNEWVTRWQEIIAG